MRDFISGDKAGRDVIKPIGDVTVTNSEGVSPEDLTAAILEMRDFIGWLTREGLVEGGSVKDPGAVVVAVQSQPGRFKALRKAIGGGAKETVLAAVEGGVAALVAGLLGPR